MVKLDGHYVSNFPGPWSLGNDSDTWFDYGADLMQVVEKVDTDYPTLADRDHRAICGLSMGGFFSMYCAARFPDVFSAWGGFAPGYEYRWAPMGVDEISSSPDFMRNMVGMPVRIHSSENDFLQQYHRQMRDQFSALGNPVEYQVYTGIYRSPEMRWVSIIYTIFPR